MSDLTDILRAYSKQAADRIEWLDALVDEFAKLHGVEDDCGRCFSCGGDEHYDDCPTLIAFRDWQHRTATQSQP